MEQFSIRTRCATCFSSCYDLTPRVQTKTSYKHHRKPLPFVRQETPTAQRRHGRKQGRDKAPSRRCRRQRDPSQVRKTKGLIVERLSLLCALHQRRKEKSREQLCSAPKEVLGERPSNKSSMEERRQKAEFDFFFPGATIRERKRSGVSVPPNCLCLSLSLDKGHANATRVFMTGLG